ncbi:MAG: hypothetical protein LBN22_00380 [Clostridiales Family XIII bacterium]|nr:hypothetical protein [Clostridiales Family XIII bacterium]
MAKKIGIAGAGPAGLLVAKELAIAGFEVHVYESKQANAHVLSHNWSDAVETDMLFDAGFPVPESNGLYFEGAGVRMDEDAPYTGDPNLLYERHRISQLAVYSPDYKSKAIVDADFRHVFIDRQAMISYQTKQAIDAGVQIHYDMQVVHLLGTLEGALSDICVTGLTVQDKDGVHTDILADLVIDATGQDAVLRTQIDNEHIGSDFDQTLFGYVFRTVRKFDPSRIDESQIPCVEHYRLRSTTNSYVFVHFHDDDIIDIGSGVRDQVPKNVAKETVLQTVRQYPQISEEERRGGEGRNLKCLPPNTLVCSGFMVVGHAGAQMNPTQGCGIAASWSGALLLAQIVREAADFSLESLWIYNYRWMSGRGAHYAALFEKTRRIAVYRNEDLNLLLQNNIMNGLALTHDYHGLFVNLTSDEMRRLEDFRKHQPTLAQIWIDAYDAAQKTLAYYLDYPKTWDAPTFNNWINRNK